jgi:hypothetical protein
MGEQETHNAHPAASSASSSARIIKAGLPCSHVARGTFFTFSPSRGSRDGAVRAWMDVSIRPTERSGCQSLRAHPMIEDEIGMRRERTTRALPSSPPSPILTHNKTGALTSRPPQYSPRATPPARCAETRLATAMCGYLAPRYLSAAPPSNGTSPPGHAAYVMMCQRGPCHVSGTLSVNKLQWRNGRRHMAA